jgi:DNA-binding NarL/FixJ family response regulator
MIHVLLADDHKLVRDGLKSVLQQTAEDMLVVGEASNGVEVLSLLETVAAEVVIMDIDMPQLNGIEATRLLRERFPQIRVVMLTMAENEQWARESLQAGAQGYVLKSASHQELLQAIRAVHQGEEYFSAALTKRLLQQSSPGASNATNPGASQPQAASQSLFEPISPRELEVLRLIAQGYTNHQIGELLFTSKRTVETHRQNLLTKTRANNTATLIRFAVQQGLLE